MIHALLGMVTPQAWGVGIVVLFVVAAILYFGGKAKLQKVSMEEVIAKGRADGYGIPEAKAEQARWSNIFDDVEEYRNDFPDVI